MRHLGLKEYEKPIVKVSWLKEVKMKDIAVIGAGPAGLTAAIYAVRSGKSVVVIEKSTFGGQMTFSPKIENYPGFSEISGTELADKMVEQALALGAEIEFAEVTGVTKMEKRNSYMLQTTEGDIEAKSVIIAVGSHHRTLGLEGEDELIGSGISFCAVCDGAFYADGNVAVIGGGNSAAVEALLLAKIVKKLTIVQNLADLTCEASTAAELKSMENVDIIYNTVVEKYSSAGGNLTGLVLKNTQTGETAKLGVDGVFLAVGMQPATEIFKDLAPIDPYGYLIATENGDMGCEGIFAAGDCRKKLIRQISTATSDGACAALAACKYVDSLN